MSAVVSFVVAHQAVLAALLVAVLDLVFALNPASQSNGILHYLFVSLSGVANPPVPPSAPAA